MRIIKEGDRKSSRQSFQFFRDHYSELGQIKYIVLYYAEREWDIARNPDVYHQFAIIIGENSQLWMSGLTWGYRGEGPYTLYEVMQVIDPNITYEDVVALEWMAEEPIVLEKVNGKLVLKPFDETVKTLLCNGKEYLPWDIRGIMLY